MRTYKPFTTEYTWQIIGDIKEYLEETNKSRHGRESRGVREI